ncbi:alanine racemase [Clostridia bacterium]|nr:alanine racemase [Clostridia bacterium]
MKTMYPRTYAAIDLEAVLHNVGEMKALLNGEHTQIMAVIKADGYGHGAIPIGKELEQLPYVWGYGVATVEEGVALREVGLEKPILSLGASFPGQYVAMAEHGIRPTVFSLSMAKQLNEACAKIGKKLSVHIKIDTGLSRLGFPVSEESVSDIAQIYALPHIIIEGIFTHFAKSDAADKEMTHEQLFSFWRMCDQLKKRGITPPFRHVSNSAAILDLPEAGLDLVRAGISIYGLWPSDEVQKNRIDLRPALSLKSSVVFLKEVEEGVPISYGATYVTDQRRRIATIPIGYGDGYPRSLSNKGYVLIHGKRALICGRICMDQFMVDVTHIPETEEGDEVVLIGSSGNEKISMEELADLSGRFNYEFACCLGKRIPRVYLKGPKAL